VTPRAHLLSNGSYSVMVTNSRRRIQPLARIWADALARDATIDGWGSFCYIRDLETRDFWSAGFQPTGREPDTYR